MPGPIIAVDVACAISVAVTYALRSANSPAQKAIAPAASTRAASCGPGQGSPHFIVLPTSSVDRDRLLSKTRESTSMAAGCGRTAARFFRHPCRKLYCDEQRVPHIREDGSMTEWPSMLPTGWFQVAWSADIAVGATVPLHYFGRDLVAFGSRTDASASWTRTVNISAQA